MKQPEINIVVPLYNEEDVFQLLIDRLKKLMLETKINIEVILVDDGSSDKTPELMKNLSMENSLFTSIFLSRNFGHQLALSAALKYVNAKEAVMVIDSTELQGL